MDQRLIINQLLILKALFPDIKVKRTVIFSFVELWALEEKMHI